MANNPFGCDRNCPKRTPGCHDKCESYQTAKKKYEAEKAAIRKEKKKNVDLEKVKSAAIKRCVGNSKRRNS